jgi:hypothetical protein
MVEEGMYLTIGEKEYLVGAIKEYKGTQYAFFIDEVNEYGFFVEIKEENEGYRFNRVQDDTLSQLLMIEFSDIKNVLKEELEKNGD